MGPHVSKKSLIRLFCRWKTKRDFQCWAWGGGQASAGFRAAYLAVGWMGVLHVLAMPGSGRGRVDGLCR